MKLAGPSQPSTILLAARGWRTRAGLGAYSLEAKLGAACRWGFHSQFHDFLAGKLLNLFPHFYKGHDRNEIASIKAFM